MNQELVIKTLGRKDINRWNEFVESNSNTTFFHKAEWKWVIEDSFGHDTYFYFAK